MRSLNNLNHFGKSDSAVLANSSDGFDPALVSPVDDRKTRNAADLRKLSSCDILPFRFRSEFLLHGTNFTVLANPRQISLINNLYNPRPKEQARGGKVCKGGHFTVNLGDYCFFGRGLRIPGMSSDAYSPLKFSLGVVRSETVGVDTKSVHPSGKYSVNPFSGRRKTTS